MSAEVEELTVEYTDEESGEVIIKELDKEVLSKGAWPTVMFFYQDRDPKTGEFSEPKVSLRRYRKMQGTSSLKESSRLQAKRKLKPLSTY